MSKKAQKDSSRELDQFYTNPDYAKELLQIIKDTIDFTEFDFIVEPSAGTGSFYQILDEDKRIGLDIEPKCAGVLQQNFLSWSAPLFVNIITIGNPPFGKNSSLAVKFFNHSASFSNVIAFIVPRTFRKKSLTNRLNDNMHLVFDKDCPPNSFIHNDLPYDVPCCFQIWIKDDKKREKSIKRNISEFSNHFVITNREDADFSFQRVGIHAGKIRTENFADCSASSHYFFKAVNPSVIDIFKNLDFEDVKHNTAGNPSISLEEIFNKFETKST
jgi:hypothetical protein